jgi:electron transport complex protein RnfG
MMAKLESSFKNILFSLLIISGTLAGVLGGVNKLTQKPIAEAQKNKKEAALQKVLPAFDRLQQRKSAVEQVGQSSIFKKEQSADSLTLYFAYRGQTAVGCAVETFSDKGFSGRIRLLAGFLPDGSIYKIEVLSHAETPGLGDKMEVGKSDFPDGFAGKNPQTFRLFVKKDGGDVDAITAATISSRAYCDAVRTAYEALVKIQKEEGGKTDE